MGVVKVKIQKMKINSSKIHATSSPRVGLDGDVDGVDGKTSPAQEEATKVRPKICNTLICTSSKWLMPRPPD